MTEWQAWIAVLVVAAVTALIRFLPFLIFGGKRKVPKPVERLGKALPYAVMGMLVVYCLKGITFQSPSGYVPALVSVLVVTVLHVFRRNTLISIVAGTVCYMLLVQLVF